MEKILIVDNDESLVHFLRRFFERQGREVAACSDGLQALARLKEETFDLIFLDHKMPGLTGLETLKEMRRLNLKTLVIVMTAFGTAETAIEAMKIGAYDYLLKPFDMEELERVAEDALQAGRLMREVVSFPQDAGEAPPEAGTGVQIIGRHRKIQEVYKLIGQIAEKDVTVLVTGESGTGKELVARAVYHHSRRKDRPFLAVNCAAIPDNLFESEVFGYERGAFTGADRSYIGKFERADGGTLFFDEIGDMSLSTQAKLLRVLQHGEFERLGGSKTIKVDVRIVAATNRSLEEAVGRGRFREDLYWRLKIISIELPPLRERMEDIPLLAEYFVGRFGREYGEPGLFLSPGALEKLRAYPWPGNVRELENCLRRAVILCKGDALTEEHVLFDAGKRKTLYSPDCDQLVHGLRDNLDQLIPHILRTSNNEAYASIIGLVEETLITRALEECGYNQVKTAEVLGISRNTLRNRIRKYGIFTPNGD